ncbi:hypothetical protein BDW62DRAFT_206854 [Aspergillus aurantiobrunneus]
MAYSVSVGLHKIYVIPCLEHERVAEGKPPGRTEIPAHVADSYLSYAPTPDTNSPMEADEQLQQNEPQENETQWIMLPNSTAPRCELNRTDASKFNDKNVSGTSLHDDKPEQEKLQQTEPEESKSQRDRLPNRTATKHDGHDPNKCKPRKNEATGTTPKNKKPKRKNRGRGKRQQKKSQEGQVRTNEEQATERQTSQHSKNQPQIQMPKNQPSKSQTSKVQSNSQPAKHRPAKNQPQNQLSKARPSKTQPQSHSVKNQPQNPLPKNQASKPQTSKNQPQNQVPKTQPLSQPAKNRPVMNLPQKSQARGNNMQDNKSDPDQRNRNKNWRNRNEEKKKFTRPHEHRDDEELFPREMEELGTLNSEHTGLYAYPGRFYSYRNHNNNASKASREPGAFRVITDGSKRRLGFVFHPPVPECQPPSKRFIRAAERVQITILFRRWDSKVDTILAIPVPGCRRLKPLGRFACAFLYYLISFILFLDFLLCRSFGF